MTNRSVCLALLVAASALAVPALRAETDIPVGPVEPITIGPAADVISFENKANRMTIPVTVAGSGPYQFLIDTGAERTVISTELASRLALDAGGEVRVHSMTEAQMVATAMIPLLEVSRNSISDVKAPSLPAANIGAAGMLGVDSLQSQRVIFDFGRKTMSLTPSEKHRENWGPDVIVVTGRSLFGRLIITNASLEGEKVLVVVDTGSQVTIGNEALRSRLIKKGKLRKTLPVLITSVTGGTITADYTSVRMIKLGDAQIYNMPVGFAEVHPFRQLKLTDRPAILLGMDALRLFKRVSVDFARKEIRLLGPDTGGIGIRQYVENRPGRLAAGS